MDAQDEQGRARLERIAPPTTMADRLRAEADRLDDMAANNELQQSLVDRLTRREQTLNLCRTVVLRHLK
jgi:hypothetical protein